MDLKLTSTESTEDDLPDCQIGGAANIIRYHSNVELYITNTCYFPLECVEKFSDKKK